MDGVVVVVVADSSVVPLSSDEDVVESSVVESPASLESAALESSEDVDVPEEDDVAAGMACWVLAARTGSSPEDTRHASRAKKSAKHTAVVVVSRRQVESQWVMPGRLAALPQDLHKRALEVPEIGSRPVLDHVGVEVADVVRSGRFYDAVFFALGARRLHANAHVIGWGVTDPEFWITARNAPQRDYGHVAFSAAGKAAVDAAHAAGLKAGGVDAGAPGPRPQYGPRCYAAYLLDPDGLRVEVVAAHRG